MPRFDANLSLMYGEVPFLERFAAAARDGFAAVEFQFPYDHAPEEVALRLEEAGVANVLFNVPPGDWERGERGLAALPGREAEFAASLHTALHYARALHCPRLHAMAGIPAPTADRSECRATYVRNLAFACAQAAADGVQLLIEPINLRDVPGYFLNRQDEAHAIVTEVGAANLAVLMDLYHCQVVEGDLAMKIRRYLAGIGHIQIAGVPDRNEPSAGEVDYRYLFALLDELGYQGWIGCEYRPVAGTSAGLGWLRELG